jgi:hypothetical protein
VGENDRATALRIIRLIRETQREPFAGIGKPEPLRHELKGCRSRRIGSFTKSTRIRSGYWLAVTTTEPPIVRDDYTLMWIASGLPTIHSFRAPTLPGSPLMVSRNCNRQTSPASYPRPCSGEARPKFQGSAISCGISPGKGPAR